MSQEANVRSNEGWNELGFSKPPSGVLLQWTTKNIDWTVLCNFEHLRPFGDDWQILWKLTGIGKMQLELRGSHL